jgi:heptaprenyl diphosphate synthase
VQRQLGQFEEALRDIAASSGPELREVHRDGVLHPGKRVRPLLVFLAGEFGRARSPALLDLALAVELAHTGTLYHDDIVDGARMRRGAPAVHARYGCRTAALAGAHLLYLSNQLVGKHGAPVSQRWAQTAGRVCEGQLREIEDIGNLGMTVRRYLTHAHLKTATLFEFAAWVGAQLAGVEAGGTRCLGRFARSYGLLFQIVDDIADLFVCPERTGRESDMRLGIYNLPVVLALRKERTAELRMLLERDGVPHTPAVLDEARARIVALGAVDDAMRLAAGWAERARAACGGLPPGPARTSLLRLTDLTLRRGTLIVPTEPCGATRTPDGRCGAARRVREAPVLPASLLARLDCLPRDVSATRGWLRAAPGGVVMPSFRGERRWLTALVDGTGDYGWSVARAVRAGKLARDVLGRFTAQPSAAGRSSRRERARWSFGTAQLAVADTLIAASFRWLAGLPPPRRCGVDAAMVDMFVDTLRSERGVGRDASALESGIVALTGG